MSSYLTRRDTIAVMVMPCTPSPFMLFSNGPLKELYLFCACQPETMGRGAGPQIDDG